ncbi:MAG: creatininase family protein [Acetobacteraceae bacterium]|nr:creatininase family protein [Acetobacteraceae bacterium]
MPELVLSEMTWPEVKACLQTARLAVVPVGSCEQHGPNQTFETDTARAYAFCRLLGRRLHPRALVCPALPVGVSYHHLGFPGTITLRVETFVNVVLDVGWSLKRHGLESLLLVNGHGGNRAPLSVAVLRLTQELGMKAAWVGCMTDMARDFIQARAASPVHGHACEGEVSQSLYLAPHTVRRGSLEAGRLKDSPYGRRAWWGEVFWDFSQVTENGALGDATRASVETGQEMTELVLERVSAFVREYFFGEAPGCRTGEPAEP